MEGGSSKGLNWRSIEPSSVTLDEDMLHVNWRPTPRGAMYWDDVDMEDAPSLEGVPELVEEPIAICEDEDEDEEEWEGDDEDEYF